MDNESLSTSAYRQLKRLIIRCELRPGEQVTESRLAEQFGFGRAAVRTSLNWLSREGLVAVVARRGYIISPITMEYVHEIFEVRSLLEPHAVARAAAAGGQLKQIQELENACREAKYEPGDTDAIERFLRANTEFHVGVVAAAENKRLTEIFSGLLQGSERLFHLGLLLTDRNEEMYHEHHELMEALIAGDSERASDVATAQIKSSEAMVINAMMKGLSTINITASASGD